MLTVIGRDLAAHRDVNLPAEVQVSRDDETLMTTTLAPSARGAGPPPGPGSRSRAAPPRGWSATCEADGPRHVHRLEGAASVAAEATMALHQDWVVFDGVETSPAFRRQGLGRHLITTMCAEAFDLGAHHGVLAASADGRALYESLGWTVQRQLLSVVGSPG
jgi:GNAT superfamily N-acetyltransferase